MKEQLFFACTAFVFAGILACQQPPNVPDSKAPTAMIITNPKTGELDSTVAVTSISSWDRYRGALQQWLKGTSQPDLADEIPWGFKIASQDIHSLDSIARGTDSLYAMLALQPNRCTGKIELTLIFQAPDKKSKALKYYDFSEPCPPCVACDK